MDIRNWPLDRIMQMPDCAFGRRWPIIISKWVVKETYVWAISNSALPETCVIWEMFARGCYTAISKDVVKFALGDFLPTTQAEFNQMEILFPCLQIDGGDIGAIYVSTYGMDQTRRIRMPVKAGGRRMVIEFYNGHTADSTMKAGIVISSVPTEVPDCLLSAHL